MGTFNWVIGWVNWYTGLAR